MDTSPDKLQPKEGESNVAKKNNDKEGEEVDSSPPQIVLSQLLLTYFRVSHGTLMTDSG